VTVTGLITDAGNNPATSGYVQFDVQPKASSIQYFILNVTTINPTTQCSINGSGQIQNFALSGPCLVWGNDNISPGNTTYKVTFAPNGQISNVVNGELITGLTYNLNAPVFATIVQINPQQNIVRANPFQTNIIPVANNTFNIGSPSFQYANGYFSQIFLNGVALSFPGFTLATNNNWTGINTWINLANLNGGGNFTGTFTGNPILSGNPSFTGIPLFSHWASSTCGSPATVGIIRLCNTDIIAWKNFANSGNNQLTSDSGDRLNWLGDILVSRNSIDTVANKSIPVGTNIISNSGANVAGHYLRNNGTSYVDNTLQPADLPATVSNCAAGSFATGLTAGGNPVCVVNSVSTITGNSAATNFGVNLGSTNLIASAPVTGVYSIQFTVVLTAAGSGCPVGANVVTPTITWGVTNVTPGVLTISGVGTGGGTVNSSQAVTTASVYLVSGGSVTYTTTSSVQACGTPPQYTIFTKAIF